MGITSELKVTNHSEWEKRRKEFFDLHFKAQEGYFSFIHIACRHDGYRVKRRDMKECKVKEGYQTKRVPNVIRNIGFFKTGQSPVFNMSQKQDYYLTSNGYKTILSRNEASLNTVFNFVIDLDSHMDKRTREEMNFMMEWLAGGMEDYKKNINPDFPLPNTYVNTGRGIQLWWASVPFAYKKLKYVYDGIANYLIEETKMALKHAADYADEAIELFMGMTCTDTDVYNWQARSQIARIGDLKSLKVDEAASRKKAGIFRIPATYNSKSGTYGSFTIKHKDRLDAIGLYFVLHPLTGKPYIKYKRIKKNKTGKEGTAKETHDIASFAKRREEAVTALIQYRKKKHEPLVGYRTKACLIVYAAYLSSGHSGEEAWEAVLRINQLFGKKKLSEKELENTMRSCARKKYKFTNKTVIQYLDMTEEEQSLLGFCAHKRMTDEEREKKRKIKQERNRRIISLYKSGLRQNDIAIQAGVNQSTVSRLLRKYRECQEKLKKFIEAGKQMMNQSRKKKQEFWNMINKILKKKDMVLLLDEIKDIIENEDIVKKNLKELDKPSSGSPPKKERVANY